MCNFLIHLLLGFCLMRDVCLRLIEKASKHGLFLVDSLIHQQVLQCLLFYRCLSNIFHPVNLEELQ